MIKPSVGRIVWVWTNNTQPQPLAAIIASVRSVDLINVSCFDAFGLTFVCENVVLYQGEGDKPPYPYAEWMPKTEQLEKIQIPENEVSIEAAINKAGLNAPRLSPTMISETIISEAFYVFPGTTLTICCLTLRDGYSVTGESACASPANFDREIGKRIARDNARNKIWALEGYLLKSKLAGHISATQGNQNAT